MGLENGIGKNKNRGRLEIVKDVLSIAVARVKKTRIMYQANLSYKLLTRYLTEIRKACLIRFEHGERCYVLTSKGKEFLEKYTEYSKRNRHVERQLNDVHTKRKVLEKLCSSS